MKINIVIPNFNGAKLITKNLPSVLGSLENYPDSIITIVDDGSDEVDFQKLKDFISGLNERKINLIRNEENKGFSSTVNKGAFSKDADLLVILNSDVSPEKNFLEPVINDFQNNDKLFGVGCLDKSEEKGKIILRGRGIGFWRRGFVNHKKGETEKKDTFWVSGGSCVIKAKLFKEFGGYDEIYNPFYWEDIDLSYRARKAGYELMFENKSVVAHRHFEGSIKKHYSKFAVTKIAYRNQFIFIWKNITDLKLILLHVLWLPYHLIRAALRLDFPFFQGMILALLKLPGIIKRRNKQKREYVKKDFELLSDK